MSSQASISKKVINKVYESSHYSNRGEKYWDGNLFINNLGQVVLEQFEGIRLIGEIEQREGQETYDVLCRFLRKALSEKSIGQICQHSTVAMRAVLSLYFVWTGIFCYGEESGHELWPAVMSGLGFESDVNQSSQCER